MDLTYEQNIRSAIIFLNTFGLVLDDVKNLTGDSEIKIFNKEYQEVGTVCFVNNNVIINAQTDFGKLDASYDCAAIDGFIDYESSNSGLCLYEETSEFGEYRESYAMFVEWSNNIDYSIQIDDTRKMLGEILIECTMDSEFGKKCICHPTIEYWENDKKIIVMEFQKDGYNFKMEISNEDAHEIISISPFNEYNSYIFHKITKGEYDSEKISYPYSKLAGIALKSSTENNMLSVLAVEKEYNNIISHQQAECKKISSDENKEAVIQKGKIMQEIDPAMYERIKQLRDFFTLNGISLFDNFICISLSSFSDEEIEALFGIDRGKMKFQNHTDNLCDAYYGTNEEAIFFQKNNTKQLLKDNTN